MPRDMELKTDLRTLHATDIWIGTIDGPEPYVALASRLDGDDEPLVIICRFATSEAQAMAVALVECAASIEAPDN